MGETIDPLGLVRTDNPEARRERIAIAMISQTYDDPDDVRLSEHDELREIRSRWFGDSGIEVVVDLDDGRVVTVWRRGSR